MLLTEPGVPGGHSAVLSITFTLQLLSLQTGHQSHVLTNFCQHGWRKRSVKSSHRPSGRWWIWDVARFTQSHHETDRKSRVSEHDFVCLMCSVCGNHTPLSTLMLRQTRGCFFLSCWYEMMCSLPYIDMKTSGCSYNWPVLDCTTPESTLCPIRSYWFSLEPSSATTTDWAASLVHTYTTSVRV